MHNRELVSYDYDILKRRFDSFMGPNYTTGTIESRIERITAIKPPYDKEGIAHINEYMLHLSAMRSEVRSKWRGEVAEENFHVCVETRVLKEVKVSKFTFGNFALNSIIIGAEMLSPIENLRYILIAKRKSGKHNYELSFACPSIIGRKNISRCLLKN